MNNKCEYISKITKNQCNKLVRSKIIYNTYFINQIINEKEIKLSISEYLGFKLINEITINTSRNYFFLCSQHKNIVKNKLNNAINSFKNNYEYDENLLKWWYEVRLIW